MRTSRIPQTVADGHRRDRGPRKRWRVRRRALAVTPLVIAGMLTAAPPVAAHEHSEELEVVAEGLANPRGVAVGFAGRVFVAEAGQGGRTLVDVTMSNRTSPICVGMTGAITVIRRGHQRVVAQLPSWSGTDQDGTCPGSGHGAIGPHGVAVRGLGNLSVTVGLGAAPAVRPDIAAQARAASLFGTAQRVLPNGYTLPLGDLAAFERNDWDGAGPDSNPYGIAILADGSRLVTDAGGNTLVRLHPNGEISLVAVFAPHCVPWPRDPADNPIPDGKNPCGTAEQFPAQAVPTGVAVGPDGEYYVSELGGFPFIPGTSRVWKVEAGGSAPASCSTFAPVPNRGCEVYATGLTSLVDIDFGRDGTLYAVQIADAGVLALETGRSSAGSVQIIPPGGGTPTGSVDGLTAPGGIAVHCQDLYITNFSTSPNAGQLLRTAVPSANREGGFWERFRAPGCFFASAFDLAR